MADTWFMRPYGSPKALERRRRKAIALLRRKLRLVEVARRIGAAVSSVHRWQRAYQKDGDLGLVPKPVPGRPKKLTNEQLERLSVILLEGPQAWGFSNELWTLKRIARAIEREFGVQYHPGHIWKVLRHAGWSCQVPERRALQRDEEAIVRWKRHRWPAIKKKSQKTWRPHCLP